MEKHPDAIGGPDCIPWEPLGQVDPDKLPEPSERYPGPWDESCRGNGHVDVIDGWGRWFAHVYCWDGADWLVLGRKIRAAKEWAIEHRVPMSKQEAVSELKRLLDVHAAKLDDERRPFDAWVRLFKG